MTAQSSSLSRRATLILLVAVLLGAYGLRVRDINEPSIWHDEGWSIRAVRDPVGTPDDKTPVLYYGLVHLLWLGAGDTPLALRYGSVLLDLITIALAASLMWRWAGRDAALLAALLFTLSPLLWAYAREIRAYVGLPLLILLVLNLTDRLLASPGNIPWRVWIVLLVVELALLYTHNLSVPVVAWLNIVVGALWLWRRQWRALMIWGGGQVALLVAYLPWVLGQAPSGTPINTPPAPSLDLLWDIWQGFFAPVLTQLGRDNALVIASAGFAILFAVSLGVLVCIRPDLRALLLGSQIALLPVLVTIELHVAHIDFHPRYYIPVLPAVLLVVVLAVSRLPRADGVYRAAVPTVVAAACATAAASFPGLFTRAAYQHDDFRSVAQYYATLPREAMILVPYGWEPAFEVYYAEALDIKAEFVGIDLHSSLEKATQALNTALATRSSPVHVELLTWYQLPADWRGMYSCMLEAAGQPGPSLTVYGITTQSYMLDGPIQWRDAPAPDADYGVIGLDGRVRVFGQDAVCVATSWTLRSATVDDWRTSARLVTVEPSGWEVARGDADIRSDEQVPSSGLSPGDRAESYALLKLPAGTPPGVYNVQMGVYSQRHPDGLDRLVNGVPAGRSLNLTVMTLDRPSLRMLADTLTVPVRLGRIVTDGVTLVGHDAQMGTLHPGQDFRVTLYWLSEMDHLWKEAQVILSGDGWEIAQPVAAYAPYSQDWHIFRIPSEAVGQAKLTLVTDSGDVIALASYALEVAEHLFAEPVYDVSMGTLFGDVAVLEGFSADLVVVAPEGTLRLVLVWRASDTPSQSYRVFTHLLDPENRVIAQHDGYPVDGERLTTGWVVGEYLIDTHDLAFLPEGPTYFGPARLEVGLYDPDTGYRVPVLGGADHVVLPLEITVQ